jgi:hypothetical protein
MKYPSPIMIAVVASIFLFAGLAEAQVVAFPGAFGFGASATGGRGGTVYHVTNLNDSGAGSFRDAVSVGNRIVVFDVGGYVVLKSPVSLSSNLTIAGQTAPGGGIGIMAAEVSLSAKTNIIMRNVRMRQGTLDKDTGKSALNMGTAKNIILDHCSFEYGEFDSVDAVGTVNVTVQNSIIADPIGQQFGAHVEVGPSTFYRNLWVNAHNRQPLAKDNTQYINNVIYDYELGYTAANTGGFFSHDLINNYFITGPETTTPQDAWFQMNSNQSVFAAGNFVDSIPDGILNGSPDNMIDAAKYLTAPWAPTTLTIPTLDAASAYVSVVASDGAFPRDIVDTFVVSDVTSLGLAGQLYKDQGVTGLPNDGYGTLNSGTPFTSTSGDGIADYWATANGISTTDPTAGTAPYGTTGYLNLEAYFNSLVLPAPWSGTDLVGTPIQGASSYNPFTDQWLLTGSGANASSTVSEGQFASQPMNTDGTFTAELTNLSGAGSHADGGLLLRSVSGIGTSFAALVGTGSGGGSFIWQDAASQTAQGIQVRRLPSPVWLQVVRSGGTVTASYSADGSNYTLLGTANVNFSTPASAGLVFASGSETALGTASFSSVSLTTP